MQQYRRVAPQEGWLLKRVREMLEASTIPALAIYAATGVTPERQWAIAKGTTKNPSVNTVQALWEFFAMGEMATPLKAAETHYHAVWAQCVTAGDE